MNKQCSKCGRILPIERFYKRISHGKQGYHAQCKDCQDERNRKWVSNNRTKFLNYQKIKREKYRTNNPQLVWCQKTINSHKVKSKYIVYFTPNELYEKIKNQKYCNICEKLLMWDNTIIGLDSPSLDRINNDNYLNLENVQLVCNHCNVTKSNRTMKEFVEYCKMVVNNHG